jgi:hypothetical protein
MEMDMPKHTLDPDQDPPLLKRHRIRAHHRSCSPFWFHFLVLLAGGLAALAHYYPEKLTQGSRLMLDGEEICSLPELLLTVLTSYGVGRIVSGGACFTACCAGQFGCLALQATVLDLFIVHPLNLTLYVLYRVLTPLRIAWCHLVTYLLVPFVSIFHTHPSFKDSTIDKFILALPIAFRWMGMGDIYVGGEGHVRREWRRVIRALFPRLNVPDAIITNTLFRLLLGFVLFPLAWYVFVSPEHAC